MLELLSDVRVVDVTRLLPGGVATAKLADLGATVTKVELPPLGDYLRSDTPEVDGLGLTFLMLNRNKRSLGIDFVSDAGLEVLHRLVQASDVFIEGSLPGAMAKYGLDYETLVALRPGLVYCSLSGYGQTGPYSHLPSHGLAMDAAAGAVTIRWDDEGRPHLDNGSRPNTSIHYGGTTAALAVVAAVVRSRATGESQYLDFSCWDAAVGVFKELPYELNRHLLGDTPDDHDVRVGPRHDVYATKDGGVLFFCPLERRFWERFCHIVGRPEWGGRGTWAQAMDYGDDDATLGRDLTELLLTRTCQEWLDLLVPAGIPLAPVLSASALLDHPQLHARRVIARDPSPTAPVQYLTFPAVVNGIRSTVVRTPPRLGEDTEEILAELGYDAEARDNLRRDGIAVGGDVIAMPSS